MNSNSLLYKNVSVSLKYILAILFCLFLSRQAASQNTGEKSFTELLDWALDEQPTTFQELESNFKPYLNDSTAVMLFLAKAQKEDYLEGSIYAMNALGVIYRNVSFYEKSIELHENAEKLSNLSENIEFKIISLNNIGVAYRRMDLVKPALDYHTKALEIATSATESNAVITYNIAVSQNSIGNIYLILDQYDLAIKQFKRSLAIEKSSANRLGLAINYQNIGYAFEAKGELEVALRNYKLSLDFNNQIDSDLGRVICYNSIGKVYIKQEEFADAKMIIEKALEKALKIGDQFYIADSYINLGWTFAQMGQLKKAETYLKKGQEVARNYSLKLATVDSGNYLAEIYNRMGEYHLAFVHYKEATELEKTINNDRNLRYVNDIIIQYENKTKNRKINDLTNQADILKSKFERNKTIFWYSILGLFIIAASFMALYRNRRLEQEKLILTLEQDMLRNQMNPHFIFNSLNSIKLYIINNEKENAVYYLNKFSKLIRKILVASSEKESSLTDELETMQLYMNIENIRFSNEIDFNIIIGKTVNTDTIKVPSFMLQPFLENALWHGLSSKNEDKKIVLDVQRTSEDYVNISIIDNGIGRKQAQKIKDDKFIKRKSVGIAITKARLANFSKGYTTDFSIDIEDLYDESGQASGTRVLVKVPTIRGSLRKTA